MVHRNAFAGPGAERNLERRTPKSFLFPPRPNQTGLGRAGSGQDKSGRYLRRTRRSLRKRRFVRALCRGQSRLRRISANREHLGWVGAARFLPHGIAKAVKRTIHWMVRPPCLLTFPGRFAHFYGGQPYTARPLTEAVPPCHYVTFPPHSGGIFLLSLCDISPTLWGNLPAPPQSLRSRFGRRLVCAPLAHGAL